MSTPYKDLELSFFQTLILKRIRLLGKIKRETVDSSTNYQFLQKYHLIDYADQSRSHYKLSDKAKFLIRHKRKERIRFWIPTTISIVALFGGYDVYRNPLLERLLESVTSLVKPIMENLDAFFQTLF